MTTASEFLFVLLISSALCSAQSHEFEFAHTYIAHIGNQYQIEKKAQLELGDAKSQSETMMALMRSAKRSILELQSDIYSFRSYGRSQNKTVKEFSSATIEVYGLLVKNYQEMVDNCKLLVNAGAEDSPSLDMGEAMSKATDISTRHELIAKTLFESSLMVAYALVDTIPDKEGRLSYLLITSEERKKLVDEIEAQFGKDLKGSKGGQRAGDWKVSTAKLLREFLAGDHKSKNQRH
jgi:hypothetical protein